MSTKSKKPGSNLDPHSIFDAELQRIPAKMRKFLAREPTPSTFEKTWEYFEGAFGRRLTCSPSLPWRTGRVEQLWPQVPRHKPLSVGAVVNAILDALVAGDVVRVSGLGVFNVGNSSSKFPVRAK
jgi:hypothetical protein